MASQRGRAHGKDGCKQDPENDPPWGTFGKQWVGQQMFDGWTWFLWMRFLGVQKLRAAANDCTIWRKLLEEVQPWWRDVAPLIMMIMSFLSKHFNWILKRWKCSHSSDSYDFSRYSISIYKMAISDFYLRLQSPSTKRETIFRIVLFRSIYWLHLHGKLYWTCFYIQQTRKTQHLHRQLNNKKYCIHLGFVMWNIIETYMLSLFFLFYLIRLSNSIIWLSKVKQSNI